jgi:hypothetical protein
VICLGQLGIEGNADIAGGVTFTDARGRRLADHARPRPPSGPPSSPETGYQHPTGQRLNPMWTGLGCAHPNALARRRERGNERSNQQVQFRDEATADTGPLLAS